MISFRLRKDKDADLIEDITKLNPKIDKSIVYRAALRFYFKAVRKKKRP